jgi:hypothetical protein
MQEQGPAAAAATSGPEGRSDGPPLQQLPALTRADCAYARCYCEVGVVVEVREGAACCACGVGIDVRSDSID